MPREISDVGLRGVPQKYSLSKVAAAGRYSFTQPSLEIHVDERHTPPERLGSPLQGEHQPAAGPARLALLKRSDRALQPVSCDDRIESGVVAVGVGNDV